MKESERFPQIQQLSERVLSSALHLNPSCVGDLISSGMGVSNPKYDCEKRSDKKKPHYTSTIKANTALKTWYDAYDHKKLEATEG